VRSTSGRFIGVLAFVLAAGVVAAQRADREPVPFAPIDAVLDQFRTHHLVALGEGRHNNEQAHAFRLALIRDPRFADTVNDIVVEFGNSRYQPEMDRFVRGEQVPDDVLRHVWQDTTQPTPVWDVPIYEEFFRAVRTVNGGRPAARHLRVLLGDPPIDWSQMHERTDMGRWLANRDASDRDRYPAAIVQREVLAKGRRALIVYGDMHLQRKNLLTNFDDTDVNGYTLVNWLQRTEPVFSIWTNTDVDLATVAPAIADWPRPALTLLRGTELGSRDFTFYYPSEAPRLSMREGRPTPIPREQWRSLRMDEQFDAILYLGPPATITTSRLPASLCTDSGYMEMRLARLSFGPPAPPGGATAAERLQALCAR
jgi:hypothetical protein